MAVGLQMNEQTHENANKEKTILRRKKKKSLSEQQQHTPSPNPQQRWRLKGKRTALIIHVHDQPGVIIDTNKYYM